MTLNRILKSKKAIYAAVPVVANLVMASFEVDVTQPAVLVLDIAFAGLLLMQWVLDLRWGSPSDGTGG